jgi:AmpD protein
MRAERFDEQGWLTDARCLASPNFDARPPGTVVDLLVIHYISLPPGRFSGDGIERLFTNRIDPDDPGEHPVLASLAPLRVSAHFLIRRRGELSQFVAGDARAWHAGVSNFQGRERCNDFSLGVELEGNSERPFTDAQYRVLARLTQQLAARWPLRFVAGHSDIAPGRKDDPGPRFDWNRYEKMTYPCGLERPFALANRINPES